MKLLNTFIPVHVLLQEARGLKVPLKKYFPSSCDTAPLPSSRRPTSKRVYNYYSLSVGRNTVLETVVHTWQMQRPQTALLGSARHGAPLLTHEPAQNNKPCYYHVIPATEHVSGRKRAGVLITVIYPPAKLFHQSFIWRGSVVWLKLVAGRVASRGTSSS